MHCIMHSMVQNMMRYMLHYIVHCIVHHTHAHANKLFLPPVSPTVAASVTYGCSLRLTAAACITYGCSLRLTAAASITYGCSLHHLRLQPLFHTCCSLHHLRLQVFGEKANEVFPVDSVVACRSAKVRAAAIYCYSLPHCSSLPYCLTASLPHSCSLLTASLLTAVLPHCLTAHYCSLLLATARCLLFSAGGQLELYIHIQVGSWNSKSLTFFDGVELNPDIREAHHLCRQTPRADRHLGQTDT